jgi:hypothetical protein
MNQFLAHVYNKQKSWTVPLLKISTTLKLELNKIQDEQNILRQKRK